MENNTIESLIKNEYPNAYNATSFTQKCLSFIASEYNTDLENMLFATSLCSDEINTSADFQKVLSRSFIMGGLGGLPYSGFTGMMAFANHVPDQGDAFVFYGPHIGITDEGELGKMRRPGQMHYSTSCGALMLALERMQQTDEVYVPHIVQYDYQQVILENTLMPFKHAIVSAKNSKKEITEKTYLTIHQQVHDLVKMAAAEFQCRRIFLLGGIVINTSPEYQDYLDVKNFMVYELIGQKELTPTSILKSEAFKAA